MDNYALHKKNVHTIIVIYDSSLWCYVIIAFRNILTKLKYRLFCLLVCFLFRRHKSKKNYALGMVEKSFWEQIVYDNYFKQGIQNKNEMKQKSPNHK